VDNASSDNTVEFVKKEYPFVEVIAENKNHAFAKGNNIGIRCALEDEEVGFVALVNTDATLDKHWTKTIVDFSNIKKMSCFTTITLDYFDHTIIDTTHILYP
jgi:GT2 family glycosyltransferase